MELKLEGTSDSQVIRVQGELVAESCASLRDTVMSVATKQPGEVVLNLEDVPFIDTSGLGVLVGLRTHMKSKKIAFRLEKPSERVKQNLRLTRLDSVFGIEDD